MPFRVRSYVITLALIVIGVDFAATGIVIGETDDAPGAALYGIFVLIDTAVISMRAILPFRTNKCGAK